MADCVPNTNRQTDRERETKTDGRSTDTDTSRHHASTEAAVPAGVTDFTGDLTPIYGVAGVPPSLVAQGYTTASACFIDFDSSAYTALTPGYTTQDNTTFQRLVAVYRHPSNPEMTYIGINVGWRDAGRVRVVKRFTAVYDIGRNETNLDF